jgi:F-type H+-transporting ATPase subunit a
MMKGLTLFQRAILFFILFVFVPVASAAGDGNPEDETQGAAVKGEESFQPGEFILEHIGDAYSWHILSYRDFELSVPLPVIVISKHSGFHIFFSSKFHHGHESYRGFEISSSKKYKGKVVEKMENGEEVRPLDFSITKNVFAIFISVALMLWLFISIAGQYRKREGKAPHGMQNLLEPVILFIRDDVARPSLGEHLYERYMPYLLTLFFFILLNNLLGLIPIFPFGANVTGNIAVTMVLAVFTFVITTVSSNRHYWLEIFNAPGVPWWLKIPLPLMPVVEVIGVITKPIVLMVRLFANITAGHIIALGFFSLIFIFGKMAAILGYAVSPLTIGFTIFMTLLELLVAFIQAYVFTLLSSLYFSMASEEHH